MTDLQKEAEEYLHSKGITGQQNKTITEWIVEFQLQSKYVQTEKLKAQIEVLKEIRQFTDGEIWDIKMNNLEQQLNQLTNENNTTT